MSIFDDAFSDPRLADALLEGGLRVIEVAFRTLCHVGRENFQISPADACGRWNWTYEDQAKIA